MSYADVTFYLGVGVVIVGAWHKEGGVLLIGAIFMTIGAIVA